MAAAPVTTRSTAGNPDPTAAAPLGRVPELDALRGVGSLAIVSFHLWPMFFFGWSRVDLFFVLSGYLVTSIILKYGEGEGFLTAFYARRVIRTWPLFYLTVGLFCAAAPVYGLPLGAKPIAAVLTFSQYTPLYWDGQVPELHASMKHLWSLAIEEQFYLVWPILIGLVGRKSIVPLALAAAANSVVSRALGMHPWLLIARCDGLALGGLLAVLLADGEWVRRNLPRLRACFVSGAIAAVVFLALSASAADGTPDLSRPLTAGGALIVLAVNVLFASVVGLVICHSGRPALRPLRARWVCYLGKVSYGVFMINYMIISNYKNYFRDTRSPWLDAAVAAFCLGAGAVSWEFIEQPFMRYKDRWPYRGARPPAASPRPAPGRASGDGPSPLRS